MARKIIVIGGVAGGAGAAAKARRTDESAEITMFERGPFVSFANCGLPYYIAGEITDRRSLLLQTPESFWNRFRVRVHVRHEATRIDREKRVVEVKDLSTGKTTAHPYDALVLAPGAGAVVPALPGINARNVFTVKTVPDSDAVREFIVKESPKNAVVVGAGFIGLESAEALVKRGLRVTVVEKLPQVLPVLDPDMARYVSEHLTGKGVEIILSDGIKAFHGGELARELELESGRRLPLDIAILSIGVRPEIRLAREAGLTIGASGGIAVDEEMRTSDPAIFAAGDAVEVVQLVTGQKARIPLAGPANKQGRAAGANAAGGSMKFSGALGTAIVEALGVTAAKTGLSEQDAARAGLKSVVTLTHSGDHAGYYPGAGLMHMKLIAEEGTGRLLGAQIVGDRGVDKRIDVLATALSARMTAADLEQLDLAYAPQFSSAKDPVVMAGFVAANAARSEEAVITWDNLLGRMKAGETLQVVDVRTPPEYKAGHLEGAVPIPVDDLRDRLGELDPRKETFVYCRIGLRAHVAARILRQSGFERVSNVTGGYLSRVANPSPRPAVEGGTISVEQFAALLAGGGSELVDVREADEFRHEHIAGTRNLPLSALGNRAAELPKDRDVVLLCQTGVRTRQALGLLRGEGFRRVRCLEGGLSAWKASRRPVVRGGGPLPILRQVQLIAGGLILAGALVPGWRLLAAFVGAGLFFAGATGWCGLAKLLEYLPWNRNAPSPEAPPSDGCCGK